jgi:carbonic anhydrase
MPTPKILTGIARFREYYKGNQELFERLTTQGKSPEALVIACSDARMPPAMLTGIEPGSLFVTRNIANIVPPLGSGQMSMGAVIEYAVLRLGVRHILIFGHTDCGGIRGLDNPPDWGRESHIARWIEHARPAQTKIDASGLPEEECHLAIVRENVLLQLDHLRTYAPVREGEGAGSLTLHGLVYHVETGDLESHDPETGRWLPLEPPA